MSKKLAEGIDAPRARRKDRLGRVHESEKTRLFSPNSWFETGERMGKQVVALITDMDQPLEHDRNALDVVEVVEVPAWEGPKICASSASSLRVGCCI